MENAECSQKKEEIHLAISTLNLMEEMRIMENEEFYLSVDRFKVQVSAGLFRLGRFFCIVHFGYEKQFNYLE